MSGVKHEGVGGRGLDWLDSAKLVNALGQSRMRVDQLEAPLSAAGAAHYAKARAAGIPEAGARLMGALLDKPATPRASVDEEPIVRRGADGHQLVTFPGERLNWRLLTH